MNHTISRGAFAVGAFALAAGLLAGCTAPTDDGKNGANDAAAGKFVACLNAAGQTAKILEGGQVGMLMPEMELGEDGSLSMSGPADGEDGAPLNAVSVYMDEEGAWMSGSSADTYPEEGGMRQAWADCEAEVPEFEQALPDMSGAEMQPITREDMIESSLKFAACARDEGYADFPDPDEDGMLDFPYMTEDGFRTLLEACMDEEGFGVPITQESAEAFDFDWMEIMMELSGGIGGGMVTVPAVPLP